MRNLMIKRPDYLFFDVLFHKIVNHRHNHPTTAISVINTAV